MTPLVVHRATLAEKDPCPAGGVTGSPTTLDAEQREHVRVTALYWHVTSCNGCQLHTDPAEWAFLWPTPADYADLARQQQRPRWDKSTGHGQRDQRADRLPARIIPMTAAPVAGMRGRERR